MATARSAVTGLLMLGLFQACFCSAPLPEGKCSKEQACPEGFICTFEDNAEIGRCRRNPTTDATVLTDASADGGVVDGARDAAVADLRGRDLVAPDTSATDVRVPDAVGSDTLVVDAAQEDAAVNPCADAGCAANTTCTDMHDGGFECRCGSSGVCSGDAGCRTDESADGGAQAQCCATGYLNCGSSCINPLDDNAHCGCCGNACTGRGEGNLCVQGSCGCDVSADAGGVCPVAATHPAAVRCTGVDAGAGADSGGLGRCEYSCVDPMQNCNDDERSCETNTQTSTEHCGACDQSAIVEHDAGAFRVPLSNRCKDGLPSCGELGSACTNQECYLAPSADGGAADAAAASCTECVRPEAPFCTPGHACCQGRCLDPALLDENCGCEPEPDSVVGVDCTSYNIGSAESSGRQGKVCLNNSNFAVNPAGLQNGHCGCNMSGTSQCGDFSYQGANQSGPLTMAGVCSDTSVCVEQSVTACGEYGGVTDAAGSFTAGATCHPLYGGPVCESPDDDGLGNCGCGTVLSNPNTACQAPVTTDRKHVVASTCITNLCACSSSVGADVICDPTSTTAPDCCEGAGCLNLATSVGNCGTCGTLCKGSNAACGTGVLAAGQCGCSGSPDCAGLNAGGEGAGGGLTCVDNGCVCAQNGNSACRVGTWCCDGDFTTGQSVGCCESACNVTSNTCMRPAGCGGNATSKTCTLGGEYWCCTSTQRCGALKDECL